MHLGPHNQNANRRAIVFALALLVLTCTVALVLWANDIRRDREHTVTVDEPTAIFAGSAQNCDTLHQIAVVQRGAVFPIRRIRYWKDCATLDVNVPNGRLGHFILGVGTVEVKPPLR